MAIHWGWAILPPMANTSRIGGGGEVPAGVKDGEVRGRLLCLLCLGPHAQQVHGRAGALPRGLRDRRLRGADAQSIARWQGPNLNFPLFPSFGVKGL